MDLKDLGLKCGLEVHQQLDTKKLFCACSSDLSDAPPVRTVRRMLRASAGESGDVDIASKVEAQKGKFFLYQVFPKSVCLVDLDEEPIHDLNQEALAISLQVASLLNARTVDETQVMRKTVVDGSNTSGFQRTALLARNGEVGINGRHISIQTVCIEEEAAKVVERTAEYDVYDLSRLGIPLVEIATGPDIASPQEAKDVAEYIGMVLRSTGKVKRGLGTIRQDLNVSIAGGRRIEIKGAQDLRLLPQLVEHEARRQYHLLQLRSDIRERCVRRPQPAYVELTHIFRSSDSKIFQKAFEQGGVVLGQRLAGMAGLLGIELAPNYRFGSECAGYARVQAGVSGIFHSDELPSSGAAPAKYGVTYKNVQDVRKMLGIKSGDAFVIIAAPEERARKALDAVLQRIILAFEGVPAEVRKANDDATTSYLRPMPGAARMYPETDIPLIAIPKVQLGTPELIVDKIRRLEQAGLSKDLATQLAKGAHLSFFEYLASKYPEVEQQFIAKTILLSPKEIEARFALPTEKLTNDLLERLMKAVHDKEISREAVLEVMIDVCKGQPYSIDKYRQLSEQGLEAELKNIIAAHPMMPLNALIGKAMERLRGKTDGKKIVESLRRLHQG